MNTLRLLLAVLLLILLAGCVPPTEAPTFPAPTPPLSEADSMPTETPDPVPTLSPTTEDPVDPRGEEAIFIEQPGNASRVTSPVTVAGIADPTFEQNLVVRLLLEDGTELVIAPATIQADLGERGSYSVDLEFEVIEETQAFIQVYDTSARDGGILHLSSVGILLAPEGPDDIVIEDPHPERIAIFEPLLNDTVSGGIVTVEGFALASFEQTLVIEVLDEEGNVVGQEPIMVMAPDLGQSGPFNAEVAYSVAEGGAGRVVVRDPSVAFPGDVHVASVPVELLP